jgi:hypothetical protein
MSKWFEIKVTDTIIYAVEVNDDEDVNDALTYAMDDHTQSTDLASECIGKPISEEEIDRMKRNANVVLDIEDV